MPCTNGVVDLELFKGLDHKKLASHVFPAPFSGSGEKLRNARTECIRAITRVFKEHLHLNVEHNIRNSWTPKHFGKLNRLVDNVEKISVSRCNLALRTHCILYCSDCIREDNICTPVAHVGFSCVADKEVEGRVDMLYFHNCHNWRSSIELMCQSGFCVLPTCCDFITAGIYEDAINAGRTLLHVEKGVRQDSVLGQKSMLMNDTEKEFVFQYFSGDAKNNRAFMSASNACDGDSTKRLLRSSWAQYVNTDGHVSAMIRLYYCVCNQLGISSIAAPFDWHYTEKNNVLFVAGFVENPNHKLFIQEESVVIGGFVHDNQKKNDCEIYSDCNKARFHFPFYPRAVAGMDGGRYITHGISVITPLLKEEETILYVGMSGARVQVPFNMSVVFAENVPHGSVTHCIDESRRDIWPSLHANFKLLPYRGKAKEDSSVVNREIPCKSSMAVSFDEMRDTEEAHVVDKTLAKKKRRRD